MLDASVADAKPALLDARSLNSRQDEGPEFGGELTSVDAGGENRPDLRALPDASAPPLANTDPNALSDLADPQASFSCASTSPSPVFCEDFEGTPQPWTAVYVYPEQTPPTGRIEVDDVDARAGSYSLVAEVYAGVPRCDDKGCVALVAELNLPDLRAATKLSVEFDLRIEQIDPMQGRWITAVHMAFGDEDDRSYQALQIDSVSSDSIYAGVTEYQDSKPIAGEPQPPTEFIHDFAPALTLGKWAHVLYVLDVNDPNGTGNTARLLIDGGLYFDGPLNFALRGAHPFMRIGVPWMDNTSFADQETTQAWRLRYDNFVVRID